MQQGIHDYLKNKECPYISFPVLEQLSWCKHGFSTRLGGVSTGIYSTMNLGFKNGDQREKVEENYRNISTALNFDVNSCVMANQTHSDRIRVVTKADCGKGFYKERDYNDIDALITVEAGITLVVLTADCVPVFLADTKNHAVGLVHSGWKGTVGRIVPKTISKMKEEFGTRPDNIIVAMGPSICGDCYEVGRDVINHFIEQYHNIQCSQFISVNHSRSLPETTGQSQDLSINRQRDFAKNQTEVRYQLDLSEAIRQSVLEIGVPSASIMKSSFCTKCHPKLFFSHRLTQGKRGTMAAFMQILLA